MQIDDTIRGKLAKDVLENPVYIEAFELIRKELYVRWLSCDNAQEREAIYSLSKSADKLETTLKRTMANGAVELQILEHKKKKLLNIF